MGLKGGGGGREGGRMMKMPENQAKWRVLIKTHIFLVLSHN
jgi:hypothetical protein